jgi:hypothetical protein
VDAVDGGTTDVGARDVEEASGAVDVVVAIEVEVVARGGTCRTCRVARGAQAGATHATITAPATSAAPAPVGRRTVGSVPM